MRTSALFLSLLITAMAPPVHAENNVNWDDDSWEKEESSTPVISGFAEMAYGQRLQHDRALDEKQTLNEWRLRLGVDHTAMNIDWRIKMDAAVDNVLGEMSVDAREAYGVKTLSSKWDLKFGRQPITWGTGDLVFLNDLFPKDYVSFFNGRDTEYLKRPSDALRLSGYFDGANVDLVWLPYQQPDTFITGERFSYYSPFANDIVAAPPTFHTQKDDWALDNTEWAARVFGNTQGIEWALYYYRGFTGQPLALTDHFEPAFARLQSLGASARTSLLGGIFWAETAWHDSLDDHSGKNVSQPNSQMRYLVGYEREALSKLTLSAQYYVEQTLHYEQLVDNSPQPAMEQDEFHALITLRARYQMLADKLELGAFVFYSPDAKDHYLRADANYRLSDEWRLSAGINVFNGENQHTQFGQLRENSNAYLRIRWIY